MPRNGKIWRRPAAVGNGRCGQQPVYRIEVQGKIDRRWSDWFGGMEVATGGIEASPITVLTGSVPDQPALRGLLTKIWDLNLTVISVRLVPQSPTGSLDSRDTMEYGEGTEE
jgi:hypothetical protein